MQLGDLIACWGEPQGRERSIDPATPLGAICTDSRQLAPGEVFVPLVGERFDGHAFLPQAAAIGAQAAVVQRERAADVPAGLLHWLVDDTLDAYQQLARLHRRSLKAPLVAVTGSAGKTTTRELIRAVLKPLGPVVASSGNENNDIGAPLTLLRAGAEHLAVVVEMGMRGLGEIDRLSRCAEPDVAVITNIGTAHIGRLGSREAIATAKCEITSRLKPEGLLVIPAGDPLLEAAVAPVWSGRVCRVALSDEPAAAQADLIGVLDPAAEQLQVEGQWIQLPLAGRHNARNLLLALAVARELGVPLAALGQLQVEVPGGRNRRLERGGLTLLDETYNASPEAVLAALDLLAAQPGRRFAVLGTMLELGDQSVALHRRVAERAASLGLDGLVVVSQGAEAEAMAAAAAPLSRLAVVAQPEQAVEPLAAWLQRGDVLLLKASRGVALERLIPLLPQL
ncbi:MAG: UDP-N-acetylmuramoyl-tripeptide--D-alanyl-D-alanine ligase [Vulcanococcus sp.]|jgi:UDP-N-acetylmuramoyl-tripeptide--D-alanyl-D-alanine ligase|uniref:UDP-N-acetylmuramoyl-tripeptide--D-alanyl-D- alanine ligase n=1 Tax=Vulcanococcus sp. TaxID=2856995 RepID=UPI0025D31878|nr:UDP-N-acetylmuramoyl-tripeptide--D-alanyl-D-alanine ligase [Vulcanococcus sp.]MBW0173678.1 UDP-N-acetylmuramoyl-tripeptide--D-alanyl-D-alanine ligase [Vulcanococcus sp.]MBW0180793.1 UDP-N-acetylmuramoyl-tripeptide--D-alanyl-D-alanine ligase [Vulcanococcus sp.]